MPGIYFFSSFLSWLMSSGKVNPNSAASPTQLALAVRARHLWRWRLANESAHAPPRLQNSIPLELGVDPRDGVRVDGEVHGELPDGRQLRARLEFPCRDGRPDGSVQLGIDRSGAAGIDAERGHCLLVL